MFWVWFKEKLTRFLKGVERIIDAIWHALDVAHIIHTVYEVGKAVAWTAEGAAEVINIGAGQACVYLETTVPCLSSPFCFLQAPASQ
ncbi:MAG TPA: hypothetical protein VEI26_05960 [Terriglobales bacterium]|nr:hypothetical protein [Terriglobales bacterium]